jgi:hypothetical protein
MDFMIVASFGRYSTVSGHDHEIDARRRRDVGDHPGTSS